MSSIIEKLKNEGVLKLYHDYRGRTATDWSGNDNDGVHTATAWTGNGLSFPVSTSVVNVADSAELQLTEGTLVCLFNNYTPTVGRLIHKRDAGGTNWDWYSSATNLNLYDGASTGTITKDFSGKKYVAINFANGEAPESFSDGISDGDYDDTLAISVNDSIVHIGNNQVPNDNLDSNNMQAALIISRKLTATEHAQLYGELSAMKWATKTSTTEKNFRPDELTDGDMEASGVSAWIPINSAVITKDTTNPREGKQSLRVAYGGVNTPSAIQSVLIAGNMYRVTGYVRGDGTVVPRIVTTTEAIFSGTNSTNWQYVNESFTNPSGTSISFKTTATSAGYAEYDDMQIIDLGKSYSPLQWKSDWGVNESVANETGGLLENSGFTVSSGAWKVTTDTIDGEEVKVITDIGGNGVLSIPTSSFNQTSTEAAYGTWRFWINKSDPSVFKVAIIAASTTEGSGDYRFQIDADESVLFVESGVVNLYDSVTPEITVGTWTKITITRDSTGDFTIYLDGVELTTFSDTTITTSSYFVIKTGAVGNKVAFSDRTGNHSISKGLTV